MQIMIVTGSMDRSFRRILFHQSFSSFFLADGEEDHDEDPAVVHDDVLEEVAHFDLSLFPSFWLLMGSMEVPGDLLSIAFRYFDPTWSFRALYLISKSCWVVVSGKNSLKKRSKMKMEHSGYI